MAAAARLAARARPLSRPNPGVAALVVADGRVIARGWTQAGGRPHAEAMALAGLAPEELARATLYVTLEPCAMCAMAMVHARIARLVFAAHDPKTGAAGSVFDLLADPRHNHRILVESGVCAEAAAELLTDYFRRKRRRKAGPG